ncbi:hypothetical protein GXW74_21745 [Roseomonas eburnea]|uniref:Uncharacterized protein n=1 Tax=Neoroseomonas eburnea TaxID=1346889 RepID=A0A9X9XHE3_9PROT|nr:hypothetical protein [Neoroseomonas eburnea]MBR0683129.1 hypothetical protein [Neoroseomonas eburnea]
MSVTGENLSAQAIWDHLARKKRAEEDARLSQEAAAKAERDSLREAFQEREIKPEAMENIANVVRRAVERGEKQALLFQFPSEWLPDSGRSLTTHDPKWHEKLEGFPKRAYDFYVKELAPRGFQLKVEIIDWPGGMPGDCGWFLAWKHPEEE